MVVSACGNRGCVRRRLSDVFASPRGVFLCIQSSNSGSEAVRVLGSCEVGRTMSVRMGRKGGIKSTRDFLATLERYPGTSCCTFYSRSSI